MSRHTRPDRQQARRASAILRAAAPARPHLYQPAPVRCSNPILPNGKKV